MIPKAVAIHNEDYRRLVAELPCIACGLWGASQCAHSNTDKGGVWKTDDRACFPLCHDGGNRCHRAFDQGALFPKYVRREKELEWAARTRNKLRVLALVHPRTRRLIEELIGMEREDVPTFGGIR